MEHIFKDLKHTYWFSENKNIVDGINRFTVGRHAAMVAMVRRHHNLFQQIFTKSNTKQMALNTHFPLLILNE